MSADQNRASLERAIAHFNDPPNRTRYLDLYAPDAVLHGYQGVEPGLASIRQFYEAFWAAFPDSHLTIDDVLTEGDKLACRFSLRATHQGELMGIPASGKPIQLPGITILRFREGKCVERWSQADFLGLLQQIGAIPSPGAGGGPT